MEEKISKGLFSLEFFFHSQTSFFHFSILQTEKNFLNEDKELVEWKFNVFSILETTLSCFQNLEFFFSIFHYGKQKAIEHDLHF